MEGPCSFHWGWTLSLPGHGTRYPEVLFFGRECAIQYLTARFFVDNLLSVTTENWASKQWWIGLWHSSEEYPTSSAPDVLFQRMWKGSPLVSELLGATARVSALIANSCRLSMVHTLVERTGIDSEAQSLVLRMPRETPCSQTDLKSAHSCCLFLVWRDHA